MKEVATCDIHATHVEPNPADLVLHDPCERAEAVAAELRSRGVWARASGHVVKVPCRHADGEHIDENVYTGMETLRVGQVADEIVAMHAAKAGSMASDGCWREYGAGKPRHMGIR